LKGNLTMPVESEIMAALRQVNDPELGRNLVELGMIHDLVIAPDGNISFTLALTVPGCPMREQMAANARSALKALPGVKDVTIAFRTMTDAERKAVLGSAQPSLPKLNQLNSIGQVVAVMSGKGGVGKSSVTALLASALTRRGKKVGILDADITGPSIPKLFGLPAGGLRGSDQGMLPAVTQKGIKVISTNLMVKDENLPVVWRGPMIAGAIKQFYEEALWGKLDYLLVDLPPGTSDATLTVVQNLPLDGVILVSSPQGLAAMVVRKAVYMLKELQTPILGVVENMSYYRCPDSGKPHYIFGPSHAQEIADAASAPMWGCLPIDPDMAVLCDAGRVEEVQLPEAESLVEVFMQKQG
jgi:Mrp family chromosome partitioning ATPase